MSKSKTYGNIKSFSVSHFMLCMEFRNIVLLENQSSVYYKIPLHRVLQVPC